MIGAYGLGTQPSYRYKLWLQARLAAPPTTIAMILIIVALARPLSGRTAQGWLIVIGVAVGFVAWTFDGLVLTIGDLGRLLLVLAAWAPLAVSAASAASLGCCSRSGARRRVGGEGRRERGRRGDNRGGWRRPALDRGACAGDRARAGGSAGRALDTPHGRPPHRPGSKPGSHFCSATSAAAGSSGSSRFWPARWPSAGPGSTSWCATPPASSRRTCRRR